MGTERVENWLSRPLRDWYAWFQLNVPMQKKWRGRLAQKFPFDAWVYQEIIYELKPQLLIELGTFHGGGSQFFSDLMYLAGCKDYLVVTVDIGPSPQHLEAPIRFIRGNDIDPQVVAEITSLAQDRAPVMAVLDSDHNKAHVYSQLILYSPLITIGSYIIVEDTLCDILRLAGCPPEGPLRGVEMFLKTDQGKKFEIDRTREQFIITFAPKGFLRRIP